MAGLARPKLSGVCMSWKPTQLENSTTNRAGVGVRIIKKAIYMGGKSLKQARTMD